MLAPARKSWSSRSCSRASPPSRGCAALLLEDETPPGDSDLVLVRREVPAEQNGFLVLDLTADDIYWPDDDERLSVESADFDVDAAREVVERNTEILAKLDECLRRPEFQVEEDGSRFPTGRRPWPVWPLPPRSTTPGLRHGYGCHPIYCLAT